MENGNQPEHHHYCSIKILVAEARKTQDVVVFFFGCDASFF